MGKRRLGFTLITTLMLLSVVLMIVLALIVSARNNGFFSLGQSERISLDYAAESALAHALEKLENPSWNAGFQNQRMLGGRAEYSIAFATDSTVPPGPLQSVNNLSGDTSVDGPLGPATVAPRTAYLVILVTNAGINQRYDVVVGREGFPPLKHALLVDGKIRFGKNVEVDGLKSLDSEERSLWGGVHSNKDAGSTVSWASGDPGATAVFHHTVSTSANGGLNLSGASLLGSPGTAVNQAKVAPPSIDIKTTVLGKSSKPAAIIPPVGSVTLGSGDFEELYLSGSHTLQGDLVLNGATLYVNGDFQINGSVTGSGALYVNGSTQFFGDTFLRGQSENKVAVYSEGDLTLSGFDGTAYLKSVAAADSSGQFSGLYQKAQNELQTIDSIMNGQTPEQIKSLPVQETPLDYPRGQLGQSDNDGDTFRKMSDYLEANEPAGPTRDFLVNKFRALDFFFDGWNRDKENNLVPDQTGQDVLDDFRQGLPPRGGLFDAVLDYGTVDELQIIYNMTRQIKYDKLGSAHFEGLVYTNGALHVDNEVFVLGGVVVGGGDADFSEDIFLTYIEEFFNGRSVTPAGPLGVLSWIGR